MGKKLAIVGTSYPFRGGIANYNERLARAYQENGWEVAIYTFTLQYPNFLFPGKSQYAEGERPADLNIVECINSINPFNWFKVGNKIKQVAPDLVIAKFWLPFMSPCLSTIIRQIKKNGKSKIITIIDNIIPHENRVGDKVLSQYFVNSVDGFITMSKDVLKDLQIFDNKKPKLYSPHPLYDNFGKAISKKIARQKLKLEEDGKYVLFFGLIRDYKGLDLLLKALVDERIKEQKIKVIVAGEFYSDPTPYHELIAELGIEESLVLEAKFIPDEEVVNYFCAADMVVQPYKDATQSGVTQIAYHFDKPMLVTNVGGLSELVPHGEVGYVINPDETEIANAICDFYAENKEQEMSDNAKNYKKRFSWNTMIDAIDEIVTQIK